MPKKYPCICHGECLPKTIGLGNCIMLSDTENDYCKYCDKNIRSRKLWGTYGYSESWYDEVNT